MSIVAIARSEIRALKPYSSARMEARGGAVMLNANESPLPASAHDTHALNRYPEPQPAALLENLAALYGVRSEQVLVGRGSDEAIDLLVRAFCRAGHDAIAICPPTFGMYAVSARIQDAQIIEVALTQDFAVDVDALLAAVTADTKLVFLCTPNNPIGSTIALTDIEALARNLAGRALLVVDEAYLDFASLPSAATLLERCDNIAVLRTLSKAHALAAARIGALIAAPEVIALLRRIQAPYPLAAPCIDAALAVLTPDALQETAVRVADVVRERERLAPLLRRLPQVRDVFASAANFLCVRFADAATVYQQLLHSGVVVRDVSYQAGLAQCLRITLGTPQENARVLDVLGAREAAA